MLFFFGGGGVVVVVVALGLRRQPSNALWAFGSSVPFCFFLGFPVFLFSVGFFCWVSVEFLLGFSVFVCLFLPFHRDCLQEDLENMAKEYRFWQVGCGWGLWYEIYRVLKVHSAIQGQENMQCKVRRMWSRNTGSGTWGGDKVGAYCTRVLPVCARVQQCCLAGRHQGSQAAREYNMTGMSTISKHLSALWPRCQASTAPDLNQTRHAQPYTNVRTCGKLTCSTSVLSLLNNCQHARTLKRAG